MYSPPSTSVSAGRRAMSISPFAGVVPSVGERLSTSGELRPCARTSAVGVNPVILTTAPEESIATKVLL